MNRLPAAWHIALAFVVAALHVVVRGVITLFAVLMVAIGIAELVWFTKVRASKPRAERKESAEPGTTHEWRDGRFVVVDPEQESQEEE